MKRIAIAVIFFCVLSLLFSGCGAGSVLIEEDIINRLQSGMLYTSKISENRQEREYLREREKTVRLFMNSIDKTATSSQKVTTGLIKYEDNLLGYIKSIKDPDLKSIQKLLDQMLAYKVLITSFGQEIKTYQKTKPKSDAAKTIIDTYMAQAVCSLTKTQNEYLSWLLEHTKTVSIMLETSSKRQADKLISTSENIYKKSIKENLKKQHFEYEKASMLYSYILSADYHAASYYLKEAEQDLLILGARKYDQYRTGIDQLRLLYNEVKKTHIKPDGMKTSAIKDTSNLFVTRVFADQSQSSPLDEGISLLKTADELQNQKYDETWRDDEFLNGDVEVSKDTVIMQKSFLSSLLPEDIRNTLVNIAEDVKRDAVNLLVTRMQNQIKTSSGSVDVQFSQIIKILAGHIKSDQKFQDPQKQQELIALVSSEIETMLGDQKGEFVNRILNSSADELVRTFSDWKDKNKDTNTLDINKDTLVSLLTHFGFEIREPKPQETSGQMMESSAKPSLTTTTVSLPETSKDTYDDKDHKDLIISASYDLIKRISPTEDNARIMMLIYGWQDPLDYSHFRKQETKDKNGDLTGIAYFDDKDKNIGWQVQIGKDNTYYRYHFPDDKSTYIEISRIGTYPGTLFGKVSYTDETNKRKSSVTFDVIDEATDKSELRYISSFLDGKKDGLNMNRDSGRSFIEIYSDNKVLESYLYKNDILIEEMHYQYSGDVIFRDVQQYYESGDIFVIKKEIGREQSAYYTSYKSDGTLRSYYENGDPLSFQQYIEGINHGEFINYGKDGLIKDYTTYLDGKKNGRYYRNYENGMIEIEGEYSNDKQHGIWYKFKSNGDPVSEIEYSEGVTHGKYHQYATGTTTSESIHVIGQHANGERTGIWLFGFNNEGYVEKVYYEKNIKIWMEVGNTKIYYNPDGTEKNREKIN